MLGLRQAHQRLHFKNWQPLPNPNFIFELEYTVFKSFPMVGRHFRARTPIFQARFRSIEQNSTSNADPVPLANNSYNKRFHMSVFNLGRHSYTLNIAYRTLYNLIHTISNSYFHFYLSNSYSILCFIV